MTDKKIETTIKDSFEKITPDVLASILADCEEKGQELIMKESVSNKKPVKLRYFASLAAVFVILLGSVFGYSAYQDNNKVSATVSLDVNPSVEIQVNNKERVLDVVALNKDGEKIIGDMDFSGSDIDVAVNALVGSMMRNGFLTDAANSILVTVSGDNAEKDAALQTRITDEIEKILAGNSMSGAILSQVLADDKDLDGIAKEYGITPGKAKLIEELIAKNPLYKIEDLVPLTINELNLLTLSNEIKFADIKTQGTASDTAYIGNDAAEKKALEHAGISEADAEWLHSKLDWEHGKMIYEVEFHSAGFEHEYDIDAKTGDVIAFDKDMDDDYVPAASGSASGNASGNAASGSSSANSGSPASGSTTANMITSEEAKAIAFKYAGVSASQASYVEVEFDYDDGRAEYNVEFYADGYEYGVDVDATTGNVLDFDKERDDDVIISGYNSGSTQSAPAQSAPAQSAPAQSAPAQSAPAQSAPAQSAPAQSFIASSTAQSAAFSHAGVSSGSVSGLEVELDKQEGEYDISFRSGGYEFDYEINAYTGAVISYDKELDD